MPDPATYTRGGLVVYGAPECHQKSDSVKGSAGIAMNCVLLQREREGVKRGNFWNDGCRR